MSDLHVGVEAWGLGGDLLHTGMGHHAEDLVRGLAAEPGVRVSAYGAPGEGRPAWLPDRVAWRAAGGGAGRFTAIASRLRMLPALLRADGVDVFHVPGLHVRPSLPPVVRTVCPVVVTVHDLIPLSFYGDSLPARLRAYYRWNLARARRAAAWVTVSEASRRDLERLPGPLPALRVVPNAVDFPPLSDPGVLSRLGLERPYLLYAGSFEPRKNLARALDAFETLVEAGRPHLLAAVVERTSGHAEPHLRRLAGGPLAGRVRLLHSVAERDLRALYTQAEAVLFPSLAEGFGYPAAQAAACGTPVVASGLPALRELLGDSAVYVDPRDSGSIAAGLARVLDDAALRRRLGESGPRQVAGLTPAAAARGHLSVYDSVLSRTGVTA